MMALTSYNNVFTLRAMRPLVCRGISEKRSQQTTLHWLSPSDPGLAP
ncbi:hypothetical protein [Paenibacillus monticola]|uniref:Uncharacterized protein n=1 Tax=Paenibacillus monticola TaxID=2666075 RepID=A0A7X2HBG0_9BACL|nr:hypothetical protein [Paenibacillus monticola]MRN56930.1 hypothetical protein [Paenibacillus monticola]